MQVIVRLPRAVSLSIINKRNYALRLINEGRNDRFEYENI